MCVSGSPPLQPGFPHHLLGVVRPALGERIADEHPAEEIRRAIGVQELQEVPGPHFVDAGEQQPGLARQIVGLLLLAPRRIRRRDVVDRGQPVLVRARRIRCTRSSSACTAATRAPPPARCRGSTPGSSRRRTPSGRRAARARRRRSPAGLVVVHLVDALAQALSRRVARARLLERLEVPRQIGAPIASTWSMVRFTRSVIQQHLLIALGAEREAAGGAGLQRVEPGAHVAERGRGARARAVERSVQRRVGRPRRTPGARRSRDRSPGRRSGSCRCRRAAAASASAASPRICASAAGAPFAQAVSAFMRTGSGAYGRAT